MTHAHRHGCWVIRTICVIIQGTICVIIKGTIQLVQLIVANDHSCKCRYLDWLMFFNRLSSYQ
jgi:hypothetical protein